MNTAASTILLRYNAGFFNTTGNRNTSFGTRAAYHTTGDDNTFIGFRADSSYGLTTATAIGANARSPRQLDGPGQYQRRQQRDRQHQSASHHRPARPLHVNGIIRVNTLGAAGSPLCAATPRTSSPLLVIPARTRPP